MRLLGAFLDCCCVLALITVTPSVPVPADEEERTHYLLGCLACRDLGLAPSRIYAFLFSWAALATNIGIGPVTHMVVVSLQAVRLDPLLESIRS